MSAPAAERAGAGASGRSARDGDGLSAGAWHLLAHLDVVAGRVRAVVDELRAVDPDPDDRFRGLYVSDEQADALLGGPVPSAATGAWIPGDDPVTAQLEATADRLEGAGADLPLRRLGRDFGLSPADVELLVVALAPDVDPRFERLYGYLNDDVTRRRASVALALRLCGARLDDGSARARLGDAAPLVAGGLLEVEEPDQPHLRRSLRVPDRVVAHLLGDPTPEAVVTRILDPGSSAHRPGGPTWAAATSVEPLVRAVRAGRPLVYVHEEAGASALDLVWAAAAELDLPVLAVDMARLGPDDVAATAVRAALRECRLTGRLLLCGPVEELAARHPAALRMLTDDRGPLVLRGRSTWDPSWSALPPVVLEARRRVTSSLR